MYKRKKSLTTAILATMAIVTFCSIAVVTYFWISYEYKRFEEECRALREEYILSQKAILKDEVEKAVDYIKYMNSLTEERLKNIIRARVYEAIDISTNIYNENKGMKSDAEIQKMIKDALRAIRFNNGRGYYFATNLNGIEELFSDKPEMEGKNLLDIKDAQGQYVIRDMIDITKRLGEGFYSYRWTKPNAEGLDFPKIAFIKHFKPYNWFIGTGEYLDDTKKDIQYEVLVRLINVRFGKEGYLFGSTYTGEPLFTNGKITVGTGSIWKLTDPNGIRIIQEQRKIVENPEGGFLNYSWNKLTHPIPSPKISFLKGFSEWQWMIGAGAYIDEIENVILQKKQELKEQIKNHGLRICLILSILTALVCLTAAYIGFKIQTGFRELSVFFKKAAMESVEIDLENLYFNEFEILAALANQMVDEQNNIRDVLQKRNEELKRTRNYLDNVLNSSPSAIIGIDVQGKINLFNSSAEKIANIQKEQAKGQGFTAIFPDFAEYFPNIEKSIREKVTCSLEKIQKMRNGRIYYYSIFIYPLIAADIEGVVLRIDEVTERVRIEEVMIQTEKMMSVGGLAAGMAHEINNPLSGILQSVQNIMRRISSDLKANNDTARICGTDIAIIQAYMENRGILKFLDGIKKSGEKASEIVANMLNFSRRSESRMAPLSLPDILDKTVELAAHDYDLRKKYDFRDIEIIRDYDPDLPKVPCVETEIQQVILNLLRNSAQAMSDSRESNRQPQIILRLRKESDNMIRIEVRDNGPGMEEDLRKRIFEPFFTTKAVGVGTGLGLSVSYFIITNNHHGTITVESSAGNGAAFIIRLPVQYI